MSNEVVGEVAITREVDLKEEKALPVCGYEIHPAALILPDMSGDEFESLVQSICDDGVQEPVRLLDGKILDGRNRAEAVDQLRCQGFKDIELPTVTVKLREGEDPYTYVLNLNLHRRHLKDDQRAIVAARAAELIRAANRDRQVMSRFAKGGLRLADPDSDSPDKADKNSRSTLGKIATLANVSRHKAAAAERVLRHGSESDVKAVVDGTKKLCRVSCNRESAKEQIKKVLATAAEVAQKHWEKAKDEIGVAEVPDLRTEMLRIVQLEMKPIAIRPAATSQARDSEVSS
jgi:hypothetical protein